MYVGDGWVGVVHDGAGGLWFAEPYSTFALPDGVTTRLWILQSWFSFHLIIILLFGLDSLISMLYALLYYVCVCVCVICFRLFATEDSELKARLNVML